MLFDDGHQHINRDGNPDLGLDGIVACAIKSFDSKMLLDPFEEQFDLPSGVIKLSDGQSGQCKVVGYENEPFVLGGIEIADSSQFVGIILFGVESLEDNDLVALNALGFVDRLRIEAFELEIAFGSGHKECRGSMDLVKASEIQIPSVEDVERSWFEGQLIENRHIVNLSVGNDDEGGDASAQVQKRVQFDRSFALSELGPREKGQA